ncbi:Sorting nexin-13 [Mucuna pruriens]|uniref:Sorting nexin-13 n=1 Tax=Mucuna pruriens TaxID=157652 RepID=A0A371GNF6_MUCPR|nr:Sorting nexin-13 [Mucuna pruriens]
MDSVNDLIQEAKLRTLWWALCIFAVSYFLTHTSKSMWMNVPMSILFVSGLRILFNKVEFRWKVERPRPRTYLSHLEKKQLSLSDPRLSSLPPPAKWKRKIDSPAVEAAMSDFIDKILKDFVVDLWYSEITPDSEFPEQIRAIIMDVLAEISGRVKEVNLVDLLTRDLVDLVGDHLELFRRNQAVIGVDVMKTLSSEERDERLKFNLLNSKELHPALISPESEYKVLQRLMSAVLATVLRQQEAQSPVIRSIARELLTCLVMQPIMNLASPGYVDHDNIYYIEGLLHSRFKSLLKSYLWVTWLTTDHMTPLSKYFSTYSPCPNNKKITTADDTLLTEIQIIPSITLKYVLHVLKLSTNLVSIQKLSNDCIVNFHNRGGRLGVLEKGMTFIFLRSHMCLLPKKPISFIHLGHPSFEIIEVMFPSLFSGIKIECLQCDICEIAKHNNQKSTFPFYLVRTDVWGSSPIPNVSGARWLVVFVDDCTQKLRSNNGKEYFNQVITLFCQKEGIIHESCFQTLKKNGIGERKNRHLLDQTCFKKMFQKVFGGKLFSQQHILLIEYPLESWDLKVLWMYFPSFCPNLSTSSKLPPKIFGRVSFVHVHGQHRGKLDPRALKGRVLGKIRRFILKHSSFPLLSKILKMNLTKRFALKHLFVLSTLKPENDTRFEKNLVYTRRSKVVLESTHLRDQSISFESNILPTSPNEIEISNLDDDLYVPISLRKETRKCTPKPLYPFSDYLSFHKFSPTCKPKLNLNSH